MKRLVLSIVSLFAMLSMSGCAAHNIKVSIDESYPISKETKVKINKIENKTNHVYKHDIEQILKDSFVNNLKNKNLFIDKADSRTILLDVSILKYAEGNAFKRSIWSSWGATELTIEAKLYSNDKEIGDLTATKKITGGGLSSIGQWARVFDTLASEVIREFRHEFKKARNKK